MNDTTAILISFLRPEYTIECVKSLREQYKDIKILVGENGEYNKDLKKDLDKYKAHYILMPYDSGVCFARNRLMELVDTEFVLVGDDDFFYTKDTGVEKMKQFLIGNPSYTLISGRVFERGYVRNYQGFVEVFEDHLEYENLDVKKCKMDKSGIKYQRCNIAFNFFVARVKNIKDIHWDENIKVAFEHSDWFISLKEAKRKVAFTPDAIVVHKPEHVVLKNLEYSEYRMRKGDREYFAKKRNLIYSIGLNGTKTIF